MSNFRKAVPRRTHKERAQPASRSHLGLLEKHSDYTQRARAYHSRQNQLNRLREAARLKNPDEFYHRMERRGEGMRDGRHVLERGVVAGGAGGGVGGKRSVEVYKRMKEQDRNYLLMELQKEKHAIERMKETLQGLTDAPVDGRKRAEREKEEAVDDDDEADDDDEESDTDDSKAANSSVPSKRHVIFTSAPSPSAPSSSSWSSSSSSPSTFNPAAYFNTHPSLLPLAHNRPTIAQMSAAPLPTAPLTSAALRQAEKERAATYREVLQREKRASEVESELVRVERQRLMMTKGRRRKKVVRDKFGDVVEKRSVFVWKQERKK